MPSIITRYTPPVFIVKNELPRCRRKRVGRCASVPLRPCLSVIKPESLLFVAALLVFPVRAGWLPTGSLGSTWDSSALIVSPDLLVPVGPDGMPGCCPSLRECAALHSQIPHCGAVQGKASLCERFSQQFPTLVGLQTSPAV